MFFTGFASGALSLGLLLSVTAFRPERSRPTQTADRPERAQPQSVPPQRERAAIDQPVEQPRPSHGVALPLAGLRASDLRDTFYEVRDGVHPHEAIDIMEPRGTPVYAVDDGVIQKLFVSKAGGNTIYQFSHDEVYSYYYAHLDRYADGIAEGMRVKRGDLIGYVGSTGNASPAAPHLHFAIFLLGPEKRWSQGKAINPYPILLQALQGAR